MNHCLSHYANLLRSCLYYRVGNFEKNFRNQNQNPKIKIIKTFEKIPRYILFFTGLLFKSHLLVLYLHQKYTCGNWHANIIFLKRNLKDFSENFSSRCRKVCKHFENFSKFWKTSRTFQTISRFLKKSKFLEFAKFFQNQNENICQKNQKDKKSKSKFPTLPAYSA